MAADAAQILADGDNRSVNGNIAQSFQASQNAGKGITTATIVRGITYSVTKAESLASGWMVLPLESGENNDMFVKARPVYGATHAYLKVATLGPALSNVIMEGFTPVHLARVLACTKETPNSFVSA